MMQLLPDRDLRELDAVVEALHVSPLEVPMITADDSALFSQKRFPETNPPTSVRIERLQDRGAALER